MKKKSISITIVPILLTLAVTTAACQPNSSQVSTPYAAVTYTAQPDEDGGDWRTQGNIDDHVTFNYSNQPIDLLVCLKKGSVTLYHDSEIKKIFAEIQMPLTDSGQTLLPQKIVFSDLDCDGCDEVQITCTGGSEDDQPYTWAWNEQLKLFQPYTSAAVLSQINPYVIKADIKAFLSEDEEQLFKKTLDGIFNRENSVYLSENYDSNLRVMMAVQNSPYFFFVADDYFSSDHSTVNFTYEYSYTDQQQIRQYIDSEYLDILNSIIRPDMNELEMTLAVYRYFARNISYDYQWLEDFNMSDEKFLYPEIEIYRALTTKKGVCHSYTYLCEFALQQLGVECLRISGTMTDDPETGHMWLLVKLNGEYYHCDPTWDSSGGDMAGLKYFGMTDSERFDSGVNVDYISIDAAYGNVQCTSQLFMPLRDTYDFSINSDHTLTLHCETEPEPLIYDTITAELRN